MSGWETNEVEHTFSSGRTFTIRRSLPLQWLVMRSVESDDPELAAGLSEWFDKGTLDDAGISDGRAKIHIASKITRVVVEAMFLHPRVWWDPDEMPEFQAPVNGGPPAHLSAVDLQDSELEEILELAFKGVNEAARFRGDDGGPQPRKGGKSVGAKPKPRARASAGKP